MALMDVSGKLLSANINATCVLVLIPSPHSCNLFPRILKASGVPLEMALWKDGWVEPKLSWMEWAPIRGSFPFPWHSPPSTAEGWGTLQNSVPGNSGIVAKWRNWLELPPLPPSYELRGVLFRRVPGPFKVGVFLWGGGAWGEKQEKMCFCEFIPLMADWIQTIVCIKVRPLNFILEVFPAFKSPFCCKRALFVGGIDTKCAEFYNCSI